MNIQDLLKELGVWPPPEKLVRFGAFTATNSFTFSVPLPQNPSSMSIPHLPFDLFFNLGN